AQADMNNFLDALASSSGTDLALAQDAEGFRASGHSLGELFENLLVHSRHFQQPDVVGEESARLTVWKNRLLQFLVDGRMAFEHGVAGGVDVEQARLVLA